MWCVPFVFACVPFPPCPVEEEALWCLFVGQLRVEAIASCPMDHAAKECCDGWRWEWGRRKKRRGRRGE